MSVMQTTSVRVSAVKVGDLLLIASPESGSWFAGVKHIEEGMGVRTLEVFGYSPRTMGAHQYVEVGS
jgi:hypothetical protein